MFILFIHFFQFLLVAVLTVAAEIGGIVAFNILNLKVILDDFFPSPLLFGTKDVNKIAFSIVNAKITFKTS